MVSVAKGKKNIEKDKQKNIKDKKKKHRIYLRSEGKLIKRKQKRYKKNKDNIKRVGHCPQQRRERETKKIYV